MNRGRFPLAAILAELDYGTRVLGPVNDDVFPGANPYISIDGVRPVDLGAFEPEEGVRRLNAMGLKPCRPDRGLRWAAAYPLVQRVNPLIIAGQVGHHPEDDRGIIIVLSAGKSGNNMRTFNADRRMWSAAFRMLAAPMTPDEIRRCQRGEVIWG